MNKYQDKEASMDDYSHERKLRIDGRYEAAHGKMADAENDFDHAHALKKDAHYDAAQRHGGHAGAMSRSGGESSVHKVHGHSRKNNPRSGKIHFDSSTDKGISTLYTGKRKGE